MGFRASVESLLAALDLADSRDVYAAIRLAHPGGLGKAKEQDVHDEPTLPLRDLMALAAERDLVARQYVDGFAAVFGEGVPALDEGLACTGFLEDAIVFAQLTLLARHPRTGALTPVAVSVAGQNGAGRRLFTRTGTTDGAWLYALCARRTKLKIAAAHETVSSFPLPDIF